MRKLIIFILLLVSNYSHSQNKVELLNKGILSLSKRGKIIVLSNQTKDITLDQKIFIV